MFKLYSKGCEYVLRALVLVERGDGNGAERFLAKDMCEKAGLPEAFTRKVFQTLVQEGLLKAVRGPGGGYILTKSPDEISLLEIIKAVDGIDTFDHCIMGFPQCGGEKPCPAHSVWASAKGQLLEQLQATTLSDLSETFADGKAPEVRDE